MRRDGEARRDADRAEELGVDAELLDQQIEAVKSQR